MTDSLKNDLASGLVDTSRKVEASLLPAIAEHVGNEQFKSSSDGLDFLDTKNSLLLSYLIDLTYRVKNKISGTNVESGDDDNDNDDEDKTNSNWQRLTEMKIALDKTRPLEKKMRYQLDKLLTATTGSTTYAVGSAVEDPLQYRPDPTALKGDQQDDSNDDGSEDDGSVANADDDDLEAAKATMARSRVSKSNADDNNNDDGIYRAPRMSSMPYPNDSHGNSEERAKRNERRLNTSELVQTLRSQYGEAPEQEDLHGGSAYGKQREAARRVADKEAEKEKFEEETMVRLVTSRKDKKERAKLLRQEASNLSAISDLGNLVRGVSAAFTEEADEDQRRDGMNHDEQEGDTIGRYENGKRKRSGGEQTSGNTRSVRKGKTGTPKNSLQTALYGAGKDRSSTKKKKR